MNNKKRIAVIGAGPMGLAAAYELCKAGHHVEIFERDNCIGGMSAAVDFAGTSIERYYHFVCKPDEPLFAYLRQFGLMDKLKWTETKMAFYYDGKLHDWGHPFALLKFPGLTFIEKMRYALHVMRAKGVNDWRPYDKFSSTEWLKKNIGERAYNVMWKSLFHFKFYELQDSLSAAWLGTRIKRVALSRKSLFTEEMGYLEGGSATVLDAVTKAFKAAGGVIHLNAAVEEVVIQNGAIAGIRLANKLANDSDDKDFKPFDDVVSTIPLPYLVRLMPDLPVDEKAKIAAIKNVGVVCVLLKLKKPFTHNFWMNINDPRIEIPGLIEYTNLNPMTKPSGERGESILYAPYYMPQTHAKYKRDFSEFIEETLKYMQVIRPDFDRNDVLTSTASRYEYSQTVCEPGFFDALPKMQSSVRGLVLADTSHYYPEDRSISESMRIGAKLVSLVMSGDKSSQTK